MSELAAQCDEAMASRALRALTLSRTVLRTELRALVESAGLATAYSPPLKGIMDAAERDHAEELITALRCVNDALEGRTTPNDDHPAWLDDVIHGRLKL